MTDRAPDPAGHEETSSKEPNASSRGGLFDRSMSEPVFPSPRHQHWRAPSMNRQVKETLDARTQYNQHGEDGSFFYRINQYVIKQEIGRGSFGSVHLCVDQYQQEYAIKAFSKSRLRKRAQSNMLRRRSAQPGPFARPHTQPQNSLDFIRSEVAIMKKLDHSNLVSLIEVLDDPDEDSLYMVMEMCKNGVVMNVSLDERADPYDLERCRCWFRDMILGIEYLHAQGIVHRDIKPDNCLLTKDNVLKISDFGVSEMFESESGMMTSKSAGSPAFMPPELCVPKHGEVSGQAADIWSMGVTLYCLSYGHLPFERGSIIQLFEAIVCDSLDLGDRPLDFKDLMERLLEKDPLKRITMDELRVHPWVTRNGEDPLMSKEENTAYLVGPPTQQEVNRAITGRMTRLVTVMRATTRFKNLLSHRRESKERFLLEGQPGSHRPGETFQPFPPRLTRRAKTTSAVDEIGNDSVEYSQPVSGRSNTQFQYPPGTSKEDYDEAELAGEPPSIERMMETTVVVTNDGESKTVEVSSSTLELPSNSHLENNQTSLSTFTSISASTPALQTTASIPSAIGPSLDNIHTPLYPGVLGGKGHAHDPLEDSFFLGIGLGPGNETRDYPESQYEEFGPSQCTVSESPICTDENIFERAFWNEISTIISTDLRENGVVGAPECGVRGVNAGEHSGERAFTPDNSYMRADSANVVQPVRRPTLFLTRRVDRNPKVRELIGSYLAASDSMPQPHSSLSTMSTTTPPATIWSVSSLPLSSPISSAADSILASGNGSGGAGAGEIFSSPIVPELQGDQTFGSRGMSHRIINKGTRSTDGAVGASYNTARDGSAGEKESDNKGNNCENLLEA